MTLTNQRTRPLVKVILEKAISPEALTLLNQYRWPGNVRELENIIYRSAVMAQGERILIKDLPQEVVNTIGGASSPATVPEPPELEAAAEPVETLIGQPSVDPFDAVYKQLRDEHETNILERAERALIALAESGGKQVKAAEILGMTRATLRKRIDQYDLFKKFEALVYKTA